MSLLQTDRETQFPEYICSRIVESDDDLTVVFDTGMNHQNRSIVSYVEKCVKKVENGIAANTLNREMQDVKQIIKRAGS